MDLSASWLRRRLRASMTLRCRILRERVAVCLDAGIVGCAAAAARGVTSGRYCAF